MCAAPKGNQFWKIRSKHGREKLFESPELLRESAHEYFEWCDENPWISTKSTSYDKGEFSGESKEEKPTARPYSKGGFFVYIGCSKGWFNEFKKTASKDFLVVLEEIENIIETQQWEGAVIGTFKENIIARTQGLIDKSETDLKGSINVSNLTPEEIKRISKELDNEY